jgi:hypothetical protein
MKKFIGLPWPMFLIRLDPVLRGWWLSGLINASWPGVSSSPMSGPIAGAPLLRQRRRIVLGSCGDGRLQLYNQFDSPCVMSPICIPTMYRDVYQYKYMYACGRTSSKKGKEDNWRPRSHSGTSIISIQEHQHMQAIHLSWILLTCKLSTYPICHVST